MQKNKTVNVFQGRVPNAAAGRHLQLHTCPLHCQPIHHRQLCRGEIKSKIKKQMTRNKIKMKKQNQNLFIVNQSITSNSLEVRSRPRPTCYTTPTSHFLKNFLKMENNLKINVQTIPIISNYHLCLLQNGTTFPQDVTVCTMSPITIKSPKPLSMSRLFRSSTLVTHPCIIVSPFTSALPSLKWNQLSSNSPKTQTISNM